MPHGKLWGIVAYPLHHLYKASEMKSQREYWVVCFKDDTPVLPYDCKPKFDADSGILVYRSYAACKASCKYQRKLYDLPKLRPVPLSEIAE